MVRHGRIRGRGLRDVEVDHRDAQPQLQHDGEPWEEWNASLRDTLVGLQRTSGSQAGSWDPNGKWAGIGGRLYSTALSTMSLEVYYRFLRIYQSEE